MDSELRAFLNETLESLDQVDAELLKAGSHTIGRNLIDGIFRVVHSIKGASGFLNLPAVEAAAHAIETQLEKNKDEAHIDAGALHKSFDALRAIVARTRLEAAGADSATFLKTRTQRVNVEDVQAVGILVSELGETRNTLMSILQRSENTAFKTPLQRLSRIADELKNSVANLQKKPFSAVTQSVPRMVRELADTLNKNIDLDIHGDGIALDARIVDLIRDPLLQLVRNAADHGLETVAARLEAGKNEFGKITVTAHDKDGTFVVVVADDGKGFDTSLIKKAAIANGIATAFEIDEMSESEIRKLVFAPGFTTAETLTTVSGRGYGLDIVRANITALGGRIDMRTSTNKGTTFIMTIPLEMPEAKAVSRLPVIKASNDIDDTNVSFLVFRAGGAQHRAVPVQLITRLEEIDMRQIKTAGGNKWVISGEDVVPVVYVDASLASEAKAPQPMLVFCDATRAMGLVVDEIVGVAQAPLSIALRADSDDTIGSIVLNGEQTDIIDISYYLPLAFGGDAQKIHESIASLEQVEDVASTISILPAGILTAVPAEERVPAARVAAVVPAVKKTAARKLILIEDSAFFRDMLMPVLQSAGFDVEVFSSADAALEAIKDDTLPSVVVSDIDMAGMSGFDFARSLKAEPRTADVPLIALSSFVSRTAAERGREAGFKTYLAKFDRHGLLKALKKSAPVHAA